MTLEGRPDVTDLLDADKLGSLLDRLDTVAREALEKSLERTRRRELASRLDVTDVLRQALAAGSLTAPAPEPVVRTVIQHVVPTTSTQPVFATPEPGQPCPLCHSIARKPDRRRLTRSTALFVALAYRDHRTGPFKATEVIAAGIDLGITRDATQAKWWNLIERVPNTPFGWWRVTRLGELFVSGKVVVAAYRVLTTEGGFDHFEGDRLTFSDIVGQVPKELDASALIGV